MRRSLVLATAVAISIALVGFVYAMCTGPSAVTVYTYHNDKHRTGWNFNEQLLVANPFPAAFGLRHSVVVDDQVDAEPLFISNITVSGATHNVVYVATENNTIYAIDATSGAILLSRNFGTPRATPLTCTNNGPNVGINSTPVIDTSTSPPTIYFVTYLNSGPSYQIHAIKATDLTDAHAAVTISASHTLTDLSTYNFDASVQRQRAALLLQDGVVYVAFTSFCDFSPGSTRGWIIGYNTNTLTPLSANELTDTQATGGYYMATVWMSGYGLAGVSPNIYFLTGNGGAGTLNGTTSIQESAVSLNETSFALQHIFSEPNATSQDTNDQDFGSGGLLLLPDSAGTAPHLAVGAGKDGIIYLFNRDTLAKISSVGAGCFDISCFPASGCLCGPSFFTGDDGLPRVVTSLGSTLAIWKVSETTLTLEHSVNTIATSSVAPGFFTAVSSNGTTTNSHIIWVVGKNDPLILYAYDPKTMTKVFQANAGAWSFIGVGSGASPNIVPLVANGRVYVGAYKVLSIFGVN